MRSIALGAASIGAISLIFFGKYKLARSGVAWWAIIVGGIVFAASTPARAE